MLANQFITTKFRMRLYSRACNYKTRTILISKLVVKCCCCWLLLGHHCVIAMLICLFILLLGHLHENHTFCSKDLLLDCQYIHVYVADCCLVLLFCNIDLYWYHVDIDLILLLFLSISHSAPFLYHNHCHKLWSIEMWDTSCLLYFLTIKQENDQHGGTRQGQIKQALYNWVMRYRDGLHRGLAYEQNSISSSTSAGGLGTPKPPPPTYSACQAEFKTAQCAWPKNWIWKSHCRKCVLSGMFRWKNIEWNELSYKLHYSN